MGESAYERGVALAPIARAFAESILSALQAGVPAPHRGTWSLRSFGASDNLHSLVRDARYLLTQ